MTLETELTAMARAARLLLEHAAAEGLEVEELRERAGFSTEELADPDARIPMSRYWDLWRLVLARVDDAGLGVRFGSGGAARRLGIVGYTMLHSRTLGEALRLLERYSRLLAESFQVLLREDGETARVELKGHPGLYTIPQYVDYILAYFVATLRDITRAEVRPVSVRFRHPRPPTVSDHEEFFRAPLVFGADESSVILRREDLELPVVTADETLKELLGEKAEEALRSLSTEESFMGRLQLAIWRELREGAPTLGGVAAALGVSTRTLQRRLKDEGTSFTGVVDSFRRSIAHGLLKDRNLAVYEIAFLLGYSEPSTFFRAFKRWTGTSPLEFRRSFL